jgi:hypothetical protein
MKKVLAVSSVLLLLACTKAREAEDPSSVQAAAEPQPGPEEQAGAPEKERQQGEQAPPEPGAKGPTQKEGRVSGGAEDPGEIPVASAPSGLMKPGAEQTVRDKLGVKGGGGGSLREALQKFQKEHDLPATGLLDRRTTEALGLDPDDIFERANGE